MLQFRKNVYSAKIIRLDAVALKFKSIIIKSWQLSAGRLASVLRAGAFQQGNIRFYRCFVFQSEQMVFLLSPLNYLCLHLFCSLWCFLFLIYVLFLFSDILIISLFFSSLFIPSFFLSSAFYI